MSKSYKLPVKEHFRLVNHAKTLVAKYIEAKWAICEIAIKVCYLKDKKGGRLPKNAYTITDFADDIEMNRKTLSCWILDYSVYKKLKLDFHSLKLADAKRVSSAITQTRNELLNMNKSTRSSLDEIDTKKVQDKFDSILHEDILTKRIRHFIKYTSHQLYSLEHEEFDTSHAELLEEFGELVNKVSKQLKIVLKGL